jgi:hypothetical protein
LLLLLRKHTCTCRFTARYAHVKAYQLPWSFRCKRHDPSSPGTLHPHWSRPTPEPWVQR